MSLSAESRTELTEILELSKARGFLGPGPVSDHIDNALRFAQALETEGQMFHVKHALDLGSGGGVPGLILAVLWPDVQWTLLDTMVKRCAFLREAAHILAGKSQIDIAEGRAEDVSRETSRRGNYDLVTARSFGPPAVTAECSTAFLRVGGELLVSEPPDSDASRWNPQGLAQLGMHLEASGHVVRIRQIAASSSSYPRKAGIPTKRPLF